MKFSKRIDQLNEGIFSKLLEIKRSRLANGEQVIDLSVGAPNIAPARHIIDALRSAAADEKNYTYAINDLPELLEAVSMWYKNRYGVELDPKTEV